MKITRIQINVLSGKLDEPFSWSQRWTDTRGTAVVQVSTDDGLTGWGEAGAVPAITTAMESLGAILIGEDPLLREAIWQKLYSTVYQGHGYAGPAMSAVSALDMALWDLSGKALRVPVSKVLGGSVREGVAVYATGLYYTADDFPDKLLAEARGYLAQGTP